MDAEIKAKWIDALRSGKFKQGRGQFEYEGSFCCLGVLCKVAGRPTLHMIGIENWDYVDSVLPNTKVSSDLAMKNDAGWSFSEIADHIEANL